VKKDNSVIRLLALLALIFMVIGSLTNSVFPYLISSGFAILVIVLGLYRTV